MGKLNRTKIRRVTNSSLPSSLPLGEFIFNTDTSEILLGMGEGNPLKVAKDKALAESLNSTKVELGGKIDTVKSQLDAIVSIKVKYVDSLLNKGLSMNDIITLINTTQTPTTFILGNGQYTYTNQLKLPSNVVIKGQGCTLSTLRYLGTDPIACVVEDTNSCGLECLTLNGVTQQGTNSTSNGIEILTKNLNQIGGHFLKDLEIIGFNNGLTIYTKVFTIRAINLSCKSNTGCGLIMLGTDNQIVNYVSSGNKRGNRLFGHNNVYNNFYSIYDGNPSEFSNKFTGNRHFIQTFTCQDNRGALVFENFIGNFYGMFDGLDPLTPYTNTYIHVLNSEITGDLNISSYLGGEQVDTPIILDDKSVFRGSINAHQEITGMPIINGIVLPSIPYERVLNPIQFVRKDLGFVYENNEGIITIKRNPNYTGSMYRNSIMPSPNSIWIFRGKIRKSEDCKCTSISIFNDSPLAPPYQAKRLISNLRSDKGTYFYVAVYRHENTSIGVTVNGMDNDVNGEVYIEEFECFDITNSWKKYSFTTPPFIKLC